MNNQKLIEAAERKFPTTTGTKENIDNVINDRRAFNSGARWHEQQMKPVIDSLKKIIELRESAKSTEDLYPILQELRNTAEALKNIEQ